MAKTLKRATGKQSKPKPKRANKKPARAKKSRTPFLWLLKWGLVVAIWGVVAGGVVVAWFAWDLPSTDRLDPATAQTRRPGIVLLDATGGRLATYGDLYGRRIGARELPPHLVQAVVAIEDRRFFKHPGVDWRGLLRATAVNLREGRLVQGGSTLTQQLAKNLFLTPERSVERKVKELLLALWLERRFEKRDLLSIYLNRVYFGSGTYGVEAAAQRYFGTSARDIDVYQAALLAGLLRAPSRLNPVHDPMAARQRTDVVLNAMAEAGYLSAAEVSTLKRRGGASQRAATTATAGSRSDRSARYFADWVLGQAAGISGQSGSDLVVETTLVTRLQGLAAQIVGAADSGGAQIALVAMTPDGAVCAMVGGRDYAASQFNRVTQALRQPGSAFKPIVYATAITQGYTPATIVYDTPIVYHNDETGVTWKPGNYSEKFYGPIPLRSALAKSRNIATIKVLRDIGIRPVIEMAESLGIEQRLEANLALGLGASEVTLAELVRAYTTFPAGGRRVEPIFILEIRDRDGKLLEENVPLFRALSISDEEEEEPETAAEHAELGNGHEPVPAEELEEPDSADPLIQQIRNDAEQEPPEERLPPGYGLDPITAYLMTDMLRAVVLEGTGRRAQALGRPTGGKTGTTNDLKDAWYVGFTPEVVTGVWVGYDTARNLGKNETGSRAAAPIFVDYAREVLGAQPARDFAVPEGIVFARIDRKTGKIACPGDGDAVFQSFREGTVPIERAACYGGASNGGTSFRPRMD